MLFDTGPAIGDSNASDRIILPYLKARGIEQLEMVAVSHGDSDHSGGLGTLLERMPVGSVLTSMKSSTVDSSAQLCVAGQSWWWDGVRFDVLYPDKYDYFYENKTNGLSCVIKVSSRNYTLLLTGDIEHDA